MIAIVIKLLDIEKDDAKLVINKGSKDGITKKDTFMVYENGNELFDPESKESLGVLEIPKLAMKVFSIQEKMTILESDEYKIKKTFKNVKKTIETSNNNKNYIFRNFYNNINNNESKKIIEEIPKEIEEKYKVTIKERRIKIGDSVRKI